MFPICVLHADTFFLCRCRCLIVLSFIVICCGFGYGDGMEVYDVAQASSTQPVRLLNHDACTRVTFDGVSYLQLEKDTDPYSKTYYEFQFSEAPAESGETFTLEVVYHDTGAGVIQPELLVDDAFNGHWSGPARQQAYTRLNTEQDRSAFFAFTMPASFDKDSTHSHLRIAGLQYLHLLKIHPPLDETAWEAIAATVPTNVTPMITLNRDMDLVTTAGITVHGDGVSSLKSDLDNLHNFAPLAKVLGFNAIEAYMRWNVIEPEQEGVFDFTYYDAVVEKLQSYGLQWFPLLIVGSAYALPDWFLGSEEDKGFACLEHGLSNPIQSIWSPYHERHVTRVLQAFGEHYEKGGSLRGVRLGPSGNYGESQYPAGGNWPAKGGAMHIHIGWWAGDPYGLENFRQTMAGRYSGIEVLNTAWDKKYASFKDVEIILPQQIVSRRQRIDFASWYTDSMTKWCDWWSREARKAMPNTPLYQSAGGWGFVEAGTSYSGQAKSMQQVQGGIRLTNETDSFEQNINATRLAMTAARHYGIMTGSEPASSHTARGIAGRLFALATSNSDHFFTYQGNLFNDQTAIDQWLQYLPVMEHRRHPLVEVAAYYPETMNQLEDAAFRHLYAWGFNPRAAAIRRVIEIDYMDEQLIRDGFLDQYKALVFCWGNVIEADVLAKIDAWMRSGGTVLYPSFPKGALETVEGDATVFSRWSKGDTGAGGFHRFQGDMEPYDLYGDFVRQQLQKMNTLNILTKKVLEIEHAPQIFMSVGNNGDLMILNYGDTPEALTLCNGKEIVVPAYGIERSAAASEDKCSCGYGKH
jgi:hypothetical protein